MVTELFVPRPRIIVPKPKSYVKLDMAFGVGAGTTLYDKSRYRSHGAITGASWATGLHGKCLDFDPTIPSYVEIPASYTQLNFTSEDFSMVIRCKLVIDSNWRRIFVRGEFSIDGYQFTSHSIFPLFFITSQANAYQYTSCASGELVSDTRYTIGVSRSGAVVKLYKNGVDVTSIVGKHKNPCSIARPFLIGIDFDKASSPADGQIEFLRVFGGVALSASEHLAYHNALA